jgi:hypothetical protein
MTKRKKCKKCNTRRSEVGDDLCLNCYDEEQEAKARENELLEEWNKEKMIDPDGFSQNSGEVCENCDRQGLLKQFDGGAYLCPTCYDKAEREKRDRMEKEYYEDCEDNNPIPSDLRD